MTEEEYLELKEYLKQGLAYVEKLREQLPPPTNKLVIPSFSFCEAKTPTDEDIERRDFQLDVLQKIGWQEIDNDLAAQLIQSYEYDKNIK